jgi:phospholipase C
MATLAGCGGGSTGGTSGAGPAAGAASTIATVPGAVPHFDHVVIVMEENHNFDQIIGNGDAPYINGTLAAGGASFTQSFATAHPSQPNYLDLFSGANQGVSSDSCPHTFSATNEAAQLIAAGHTFTGYSEGLPAAGSTKCTAGPYARKHSPWVNFSNVPANDNQPFSAFPSPADYASLPTVSWVIPNLDNDMHDGTVAQGDTWLKNNSDSYAQWAKTHHSLLIVTWDEDDMSQHNQIATIFYGADVKPGQYPEKINHFNVLRTVEDIYGLPSAGAAATSAPITDVWGS